MCCELLPLCCRRRRRRHLMLWILVKRSRLSVVLFPAKLRDLSAPFQVTSELQILLMDLRIRKEKILFKFVVSEWMGLYVEIIYLSRFRSQLLEILSLLPINTFYFPPILFVLIRKQSPKSAIYFCFIPLLLLTARPKYFPAFRTKFQVQHRNFSSRSQIFSPK